MQRTARSSMPPLIVCCAISGGIQGQEAHPNPPETACSRSCRPACLFEVAAVGPYQLPLTTMAILRGGYVRVGLEDNLYYRKGQLLRSNAEAVERIVRIARELNRQIATPTQARELLSLAPTPSQP